MPGAAVDKLKRQRVKIYQWGSESKCRTKCVHTLVRKQGAVATRVVSDAAVAAILATLDMSAECS
jgi:hypothetical protein